MSNRQVDESTSDNVSIYAELASIDYDDVIETSLATSFLTAVLYRKSRTLPEEIDTAIDPDVRNAAKECANWDIPGEGYFNRIYKSWLNRTGPEKRWMFYVHAGVYHLHGIDPSGALHDPIESYYDRKRPTYSDHGYDHILNQDLVSVSQAFQKTSAPYESCALNVRNELLDNLICLQRAQTMIISRYLGETDGFIQPAILRRAVKLGMAFTDELHQWEVKSWLPSAIIRAMEQYTIDHQGNVGKPDFYFDR